MTPDPHQPGDLPDLPEPLPLPVVDNHCHLDVDRGAGTLPVEEALRRAEAVGVTRIVQIGCDLERAAAAVRLAEEYEQIVAGVALHPNDAPLHEDLDAAVDRIRELAVSSDRVRAVGETGLDFYRTAPEGREAQEESFRRHIRLAVALDRTLVIHDRDAHEDVLRILDDEGVPSRWVMHCFSGDEAFARACLDRGAHLSFAGTVTFRNAGPLRQAARVVPADRLLVETDAPYLTPHPFRGRTNASYLVPLTVRALAEVRAEPLEAVCAAVTSATEQAFGGGW